MSREQKHSISGFTLLEVMIALAIMAIAVASVTLLKSNATRNLEASKKMTIVTMLARNAMIEAETTIEGKTFTEVKEEETGQFEAPYQEYQWIRKVKEVEIALPNLGDLMKKMGGGEDTEDPNSGNVFAEQLMKIVSKYLSEAVREVSVTIKWPTSRGSDTFTLTTLWINLNHVPSLQP